MSERYQVRKTHTGGDLEFMVVDTNRPFLLNNGEHSKSKHRIWAPSGVTWIEEYDYDHLCQCFYESEAQEICDALNERAAKLRTA